MSILFVVFGLLPEFWSTPTFAADNEIKSFDIPAESADKALKEFSDQSGVEVIFGTATAASVRTHAVKGDYEPRTAIKLLLEDTGLVVTANEKTGALTVSRDPSARKAVPDAIGDPIVDQKTPPDETVKLSTYVVTGSNIPTAADASDVPVVILGRQQIDSTGIQTNPLELLRKTVPAFAGGRSNTGAANGANNNQATGGGSQIYLRNLPTLVLLDGRRITYSGLNGSGGKNFVDVNMFPISAIDHIEVLSDGASAIYGSDAIGGVVNIILKSDFSGVEVGGRYGATTNAGHYSEKSAYVIAGAKNDSVSVTVSGNWSKTDPLFQNQRPFIHYDPRGNLALPGSVGGNILDYSLKTPSSGNPVGAKATASSMADLIANGTYLAAGSPSIVPFNIAPYTSMLLASELKSTTIEYSAKFSDKVSLFGNALYSKTHTSNQLATSLSSMVQVGVTVPAGSPYNPLTVDVPKVVVGTTDTPRQTINDSDAYLYTVGLRGNIDEDWNWEAGYTYSFSKEVQNYTNTVFMPAFNAAIAGGYDANGNPVAGGAYSKVPGGFSPIGPLVIQPALDPFARSGVNPASLANVYGTEVAHTDASLGSVDAKVVGTPFSLPAGKVGFAAGGAVRMETLSGTPDNNSYNASTDPTKHNWGSGATFFDRFSKNRIVKAYFAELRLPLASPAWSLPGAHALDLSLAARSETYSDAGNSKVPKIGFRWQPVDEQFTVRFTYSKSFAAPWVIDEFGPASYLLVPPPVSGINSGVSYYNGNGNNPALRPAYAWSRSIGVVYSPKYIKGLTVSANYINVFEKGAEAAITAFVALPSVQALGAASPYFNTMSVGAPLGQPGATQAPIAAPGSLYPYMNSPSYTNNVYFLDHNINAGGVHVRAVDFTADYELPTPNMGRFDLTAAGTYLISSRVAATADAPFEEFAGDSANNPLGGGSQAKWTVYTTLDWNYNDWDFVVGSFYRNRMADISSGTLPSVWLANNPTTYVPYYISWDAQVGYTIGKKMANSLWSYLNGVKVTIGVNNVFNRMPPYAPLSAPIAKNFNGADVAAYSPIGRLVFISFSAKF